MILLTHHLRDATLADPKDRKKRDPTKPSNPYRFSKVGTNIKCSVCKKLGHKSRTCPLAKKKKSKTGSKVLYLIITLSLFNYLYTCCMVLMYYMLLQKGKKKSAVTLGARTSKNGAVTVSAGTSDQATACGRLSSAGGATGTAGATGTGTVARTVSAAGTGATTGIGAAVGTGAAAGGGASRKAKVVVVPTVEKVMTRIATKKQKKQ
jgi:hypothetical protein